MFSGYEQRDGSNISKKILYWMVAHFITQIKRTNTGCSLSHLEYSGVIFSYSSNALLKYVTIRRNTHFLTQFVNILIRMACIKNMFLHLYPCLCQLCFVSSVVVMQKYKIILHSKAIWMCGNCFALEQFFVLEQLVCVRTIGLHYNN
jgi:hypothetical protein